MKNFGPVLGNFPILRLPASRIRTLSGDDQLLFYAHWPHNIIRKAWLGTANSTYGIRTVLRYIAAKEYALHCEVRGEVLTEHGLIDWIEKVQSQHEREICFGLFMQEEIYHLYDGKAGPILRKDPTYLECCRSSLPPPQFGVLILAELLRAYRKDANALIRETAIFASTHSGRDHCLGSLPVAVQERFEEANEWKANFLALQSN